MLHRMLFTLREASCPVVSCSMKRPYGTELTSPASSQWGPVVHQQPHEHTRELGNRFSTCQALTVAPADTSTAALWATWSQRHPVKVHPETLATGTGTHVFVVLNWKFWGKIFVQQWVPDSAALWNASCISELSLKAILVLRHLGSSVG